MIERKIDTLGRIVIPKEMRRKLSMQVNSPVDITIKDDTIVIKRSSNICKVCGKSLLAGIPDKTSEEKYGICFECMKKIQNENLA